ERRFQKVTIEEPTVEDTISILRGLKSRFEAHHGVNISDPALIQAAILSDRYISDRFLPDKAIDLIDEACASIRMEIDSMPLELDDVTRKLMQLEIEKKALAKEKDPVSKERLKKIEEEIREKKKKEQALRDQWTKEKAFLNRIKEQKKELENYRLELQTALNENDYSKAAELQYSTIPEYEKAIQTMTDELKGQDRLLTEVVSEESIAEIVSKWTHIPVTRLMAGDKEKLLNLEDTLRKRVIGQDHALKLVSDAIIRQRAGIKDVNRPIGTFFFLGPTGVGKTEVARSLAEALFSSESHMIRIDMSEYMEAHSVARLIGSPPGYVGYDEGGQLTEAVRRKPYSIILFDEIEKAHREVFNILLQILDDGRLTDNQGRTVDFKNTIIILTSNLGSEHLLHADEDAKERVMKLVKANFKPEFLNRIDELIIFNPLTFNVQVEIIKKMLTDLSKRLLEKDIRIDFDKSINKFILENGYDEEYGARPLQRFIQRHIETLIAQRVIEGAIEPHENYRMLMENDQPVVRKESE
ncbi:MAG: AAA family ATPase, partial [Acholeplasmataceae bacterium]